MKAYFLSGLGADRRAFENIRLPQGYEPVHIDWIPPQQKESLPHYASRLAELISAEQEFILVGLSFGGMVATEIASIKKPGKTIIISSIACSNELPWYFRRAGKIGLHKMFPIGLLKSATMIRRFFGAGTKREKEIVYEYARSVDPSFVRWSLDAILKWERKERIPGIIHIHGTHDHLLPSKYLQPDYKVNNAGHLMVLSRADEVNSILNRILS